VVGVARTPVICSSSSAPRSQINLSNHAGHNVVIAQMRQGLSTALRREASKKMIVRPYWMPESKTSSGARNRFRNSHLALDTEKILLLNSCLPNLNTHANFENQVFGRHTLPDASAHYRTRTDQAHQPLSSPCRRTRPGALGLKQIAVAPAYDSAAFADNGTSRR